MERTRPSTLDSAFESTKKLANDSVAGLKIEQWNISMHRHTSRPYSLYSPHTAATGCTLTTSKRYNSRHDVARPSYGPKGQTNRPWKIVSPAAATPRRRTKQRMV